jgi:hypothetical protein
MPAADDLAHALGARSLDRRQHVIKTHSSMTRDYDASSSRSVSPVAGRRSHERQSVELASITVIDS